MRASAVLVAAGAVVASLLLPVDHGSSALAHGTSVNVIDQDRGADPPNTLPHYRLARWADVLQSARTLTQGPEGKRVVRVSVGSRRNFPIPDAAFRGPGARYLYVAVSLDSRGGPGNDYGFWYAQGKSGSDRHCWVYDYRVGDDPIANCRMSARDGALVLAAPARLFRITKPIRWRVKTILEFPDAAFDPFDLAPNHGWYP